MQIVRNGQIMYIHRIGEDKWWAGS